MDSLLKVFLLSMMPIGELRLAIPAGVLFFHLNIAPVFLVSLIGNMVPPLFILFLFDRVSPLLSRKSRAFSGITDWWKKRTLQKHSRKIQEYEFLGLMLLVGIPLPFTGAYTGALLAVLMNLAFKKSVAAIFAGVVISGIIVSLLVIFGINVELFLGWQALLGLALISAGVYWYLKKRKHV